MTFFLVRKFAHSASRSVNRGDAGGDAPVVAGALQDCATVGELSWDGAVRPVKGVLSMATAETRQQTIAGSLANAREAAVVEVLAVFGVRSLNDAVGLLLGHLQFEPVPSGIGEVTNGLNRYDAHSLWRRWSARARSARQSYRPHLSVIGESPPTADIRF